MDAVVEWGMAKDPSERPASATALLQAAAEALRTPPPEVTAEPAPPRLHLVPSRSHAGPAAAGTRVAPVRSGPARPRARALGRFAAAVAIAAACGALAAALTDPFGDNAPAKPAVAAGSGVWDRLADRRAELRDELAAADSPDDQAAAMTELASLYTAAARARGPARLRVAARDAGAAYSELAVATLSGDESAFAEAGEAVTEAELALTAAAARR
jgi:hypothetical protein